MDKVLITLEEFARKVGISRSTVNNWVSEGKLVVGRHVIRLGRVTRVLWSEDLLQDLLALSVRLAPTPRSGPLVRAGKGSRTRRAFDVESAREFLGADGSPSPGVSADAGVELKTGRKTPGTNDNTRGYGHEQ